MITRHYSDYLNFTSNEINLFEDIRKRILIEDIKDTIDCEYSEIETPGIPDSIEDICTIEQVEKFYNKEEKYINSLIFEHETLLISIIAKMYQQRYKKEIDKLNKEGKINND